MNLTSDLTELVDRLEPIARPGGQGRAMMVMGARPGAGASTVARELARLSAQRSQRGVWLYDLDFSSNSQAAATRAQGATFDAGFGRAPFWTLRGEGGRARIVARQSVIRDLFVTELQSENNAVRSVGLRSSPEYWDAVRQSIDMAIIDAPGNSRAPLSLVGDLDGVILVADARDPNYDGLAARRAAIEEHGGIVAGLILNRAGSARSAA
jgi:Mrp family chromosome partitioning ATPase